MSFSSCIVPLSLQDDFGLVGLGFPSKPFGSWELITG